MDWAQVVTIFAVMATNLGTVIALYFHLDNKTTNLIEMHRKETYDILQAIQQEMKDFHARLCVIEERNKGK